jgi:hypothetical protein
MFIKPGIIMLYGKTSPSKEMEANVDLKQGIPIAKCCKRGIRTNRQDGFCFHIPHAHGEKHTIHVLIYNSKKKIP